MKKKNCDNLKTLIAIYCCFVFFFMGFSCTKRVVQEAIEEIPSVYDGTVKVSKLEQLDINRFKLTYTLDSLRNVVISSYGFIAEPVTHDAFRRVIVLGDKVPDATVNNFILDSLAGKAAYRIRLFVNQGTDTIFSNTVGARTGRFEITGFSSLAAAFNSPAKRVIVTTNLTSSVKERTSRIFIGDRECSVLDYWDNVIHFEIPGGIDSGYQELKIQCNGMEADSVIRILYGAWEQLEDYFVPPPYGASNYKNYLTAFTVASAGSKGYVIGGSYNMPIRYPTWEMGATNNNNIWVYDQPSNRWSYITPKVEMCFLNPVAQVMQGRLFVVGGDQKNFGPDSTFSRYTNVKTVFEFDFANNLWIAKAPLPDEIINQQQYSFQYGDEIFYGTGRTLVFYYDPDYRVESIDGKFWCYNIKTNTWRKRSSFPGRIRVNAGAFVIGDKAYMYGGGLDAYTSTNELWEYDIIKDAWAKVRINGFTPNPGTDIKCFTHKGKAYILNSTEGPYNFSVINHNWQYDPATRTFTEIASPIKSISERKIDVAAGCISSVGNAFVLIGKGSDGDGTTANQDVHKLTLY